MAQPTISILKLLAGGGSGKGGGNYVCSTAAKNLIGTESQVVEENSISKFGKIGEHQQRGLKERLLPNLFTCPEWTKFRTGFQT